MCSPFVWAEERWVLYRRSGIYPVFPFRLLERVGMFLNAFSILRV